MGFSPFAEAIRLQKYAHDSFDGGKETWKQTAERVAFNVLEAVGASEERKQKTALAIEQRKFLPGGRYLYATGRPVHQVNNCLLLKAEDSREGWADLLHKSAMALMTGAGIGVWYSDVRPEGAVIKGTGGLATGPISLMKMLNECGRGIMQGGSRRSAIWAGLQWDHPDIFKFIRLKDWPDYIKRAKNENFNAYAPMDGTNISVGLNTEFFEAYDTPGYSHTFERWGQVCKVTHELAHEVYWAVVRNMMETGEPGFSVDAFQNEYETLRNACTELVSYTDSDVCNLGSINMARVESLEEMQELVELGTVFLLAGTVYSDLPYDKVAEVRAMNRRLGLGLMGLHEFLLLRGYKYEPHAELEKYLEVYATSTEIAHAHADALGLSRPVKTRAIAPTGSIGILGETTTGIEPIFCVAYKRRYLDGQTWKYQYVVDPTAQALIDRGVAPELIEDAYTLAKDPERRLAFQAWVQKYVDHGISSTINLPQWGSQHNNAERVKEFGETLMKYLPDLRGVTVYPDGARGGQPLTPVLFKTAVAHPGQVFYEQADICDITKAGTCGS